LIRKTSKGWRRNVSGVLLVAFLFGCSPAQRPSLVDPEIIEAMLRYQFAHNASGVQGSASVYCIGFGSGSANSPKYQDPPPKFLARFTDVTPKVKAYSQCSRAAGNSVVDKTSGKRGLVFKIDSVKCASASECEVEGGYYEANESSSGNTYYLQKRAGKWVVVKDVMHWIS